MPILELKLYSFTVIWTVTIGQCPMDFTILGVQPLAGGCPAILNHQASYKLALFRKPPNAEGNWQPDYNHVHNQSHNKVAKLVRPP